jgi:hypothetical protein
MMNNNLEVYNDNLFLDLDVLQKKLPPAMVQRIIRLRDLYTWWVQFPSKKDKEIVTEDMHRHHIQIRQAYDDLNIIKYLIGNLQTSSKDYIRWHFNHMILDIYDQARREHDNKAAVAALDKYAKYNQLDKQDAVDNGFDQLRPQCFMPTSDPSVIGINPIPNIEDKISKLLKKMSADINKNITVEEADFEQIYEDPL